jgi:hypothetical protein
VNRAALGWSLLAVVPLALVVAVVGATAVNAPFADQWELVLVLRDWVQGDLSGEIFWRQHNEHRIPLPKALHFGLALATGYDVRAELVLNLVVAVIGFVVLVRLVDRTMGESGVSVPRWLVPVVALLYFSLVQWQNWVWGWQIEWFIANAAAISTVYLLTGIRSGTAPASIVAILIGSMLVALAGTFSFGGAVHLWPVGLFTILASPRIRRYWPLWTAAGIGVALLYGSGLVLPPESSPLRSLVERPLASLRFALAVLGRPLSVGSGPLSLAMATVIGAGILTAFVAVVVRLRRRARVGSGAIVPWIALGLYALLNAASSGLGRSAFGAATALASRYATVAILLVIATLVLAVMLARTAPLAGAWRHGARGALVALVALALAGSAWGVNKSMQHRDRLLGIRACLERLAERDDDCMESLYPNREALAPRVETLRRLNWIGFRDGN